MHIKPGEQKTVSVPDERPLHPSISCNGENVSGSRFCTEMFVLAVRYKT